MAMMYTPMPISVSVSWQKTCPLFILAGLQFKLVHSFLLPPPQLVLGWSSRVGDRRGLHQHDLHEHLDLYLQNDEEGSLSSSTLKQPDIRTSLRKIYERMLRPLVLHSCPRNPCMHAY